ncbi:MAG: S-methyl-5'-thioadenosine phosphorylase [Hamadaea sp.]|uniref:S-methyl-5'-thioadenosine phosphorylase n=1 Tax=Hamadaea sp. TaxID=2024425 RepID=UPI0017B83AEB|nr:S-methyl-5'-thioadenosine phosphorylase [Hamadaea sp.]NUR74485.1 S-methyl-5'-thioadenosine phosphorylase [Hamadaea sp.]NUT23963.1 S-methyl-5'-thioadenosine phosphorylase [Hamadaea sp.]
MSRSADLAVIGGSGLYALLADAVEQKVDTPYGDPSDVITIADVGGRSVAFLPRHGRDHRLPPHRINYRANLWALRSLGVRQILAPCAVGGLRPELGPGTFVLPDQVVDRTASRVRTFYDVGAVHVNYADPYCPAGRAAVLRTAAEREHAIVDGGTMFVIEGPRFSSRAESRTYTAAGGSVINMTGEPEATLARELGLCYTSIALVTDLDAGVEGDHGVTQEEVFRVFRENTERLRDLLLATLAQLPAERTCPCPSTLDGLALPFELP